MFLYSLNWLFPLLLKDSLFSLVFFSRLLSWTKNKLHTLTNYIFIIHIFLLKAYFYSKHNCVFIDDKIEKRATHFPVLVLYIDRYISSSIIVCSNNNNNNTEIYKTYESCFFFFWLEQYFLTFWPSGPFSPYVRMSPQPFQDCPPEKPHSKQYACITENLNYFPYLYIHINMDYICRVVL